MKPFYCFYPFQIFTQDLIMVMSVWHVVVYRESLNEGFWFTNWWAVMFRDCSVLKVWFLNIRLYLQNLWKELNHVTMLSVVFRQSSSAMVQDLKRTQLCAPLKTLKYITSCAVSCCCCECTLLTNEVKTTF